MRRLFLILSGLFALGGVALGAFGAHALQAGMREAFETGVRYHFYHALGLGLVAVVMDRFGSRRLLLWSGWLMAAGIVLFSGSLYLLAASGNNWFALATPVGGTAFLLAWVLFVVAVCRRGH
jgi:uncharacterized membrane protein YgdD (TMEM256/DUF423 family)